MKTIGSIREVLSLSSDLSWFIMESCPWMAGQWEPEIIGYVFVLEDRDIRGAESAPRFSATQSPRTMKFQPSA